MEQTLTKLLTDYDLNPRKFAAKYNSNTKSTSEKCKNFVAHIDDLLNPDYKRFGKQNFSEIFYNMKHNYSRQKCKICEVNFQKFLNYEKGYSDYCSKECAISDSTRISESARKEGTEKRKEKMKILLNDPVLGKEYRSKISKKSSIYMNLPEVRLRYSNALKERILKNEWTPNITDSWTKKRIMVDGIPFRSSFEALFYVYHHCYKNASNLKFEKLRIEYEYNGKKPIYIVDFIDEEKKIVYEIKPASLTKTDKNAQKRLYLLRWCETNKYSYEEIDETDLKSYLVEMKTAMFDHDFIQTFTEKYKKWQLK